MGNKKMMDFTVVENHRLNNQYSLLKLAPVGEAEMPELLPGQFVQVAIDDSPRTYLRRPISINYYDESTGLLWLLVRKAGEGTAHLIEKPVGAKINLLIPLGNGFPMPEADGKVLLIGGGVGVAPLLYLGKKLSDSGIAVEFMLGARSKDDLLELDSFKAIGAVHITTDDGSEGVHGVVTQHPVMSNRSYTTYYCCGPAPMMKAVAKAARAVGAKCYVSLENMMACGVGACLCCVEKTVKGNVCVCTEGPVFDIEKLLW